MIRESALQHGRSSLGWRTDLLPAHHSQTKPGEGCPCFRRQSMAAPTDALALRLDCRVRTSRRIGRIFHSRRCFFFVSLVLKSLCSQHHCHLQTELPLYCWSCTTSMISSSTSAKRRVGRLAQLSAKRTPVRVPESHFCIEKERK